MTEQEEDFEIFEVLKERIVELLNTSKVMDQDTVPMSKLIEMWFQVLGSIIMSIKSLEHRQKTYQFVLEALVPHALNVAMELSAFEETKERPQ